MPINLDISINIPTIKIKGISLNLKNLKNDLFFFYWYEYAPCQKNY